MQASKSTGRLEALRALLAADPEDLLARLLLGTECLAEGVDGAEGDAAPRLDLCREAEGHLSVYVARFEGDKGAACLSLARAREALGDRAGALSALAQGAENAAAHRHLQLSAALVAERERLGG